MRCVSPSRLWVIWRQILGRYIQIRGLGREQPWKDAQGRSPVRDLGARPSPAVLLRDAEPPRLGRSSAAPAVGGAIHFSLLAFPSPCSTASSPADRAAVRATKGNVATCVSARIATRLGSRCLVRAGSRRTASGCLSMLRRLHSVFRLPRLMLFGTRA